MRPRKKKFGPDKISTFFFPVASAMLLRTKATAACRVRPAVPQAPMETSRSVLYVISQPLFKQNA